MFGSNQFGANRFANVYSDAETGRYWVDKCPPGNSWSPVVEESDSWSDNSAESSEWVNRDKNMIYKRKCNGS